MNISARLGKIAEYVAPAYRAAPNNALLLCLTTTGLTTTYAAPMLRAPSPLVGFALDDQFAAEYAAALKANLEIHDGAIIAQRNGWGYAVVGWSYRLFPPPIETTSLPNRGSAFHSCLAMSAVEGVDGLLLFTGKMATIFYGGKILSEAKI